MLHLGDGVNTGDTMPSKLPRVNVVVSVEQHELLMELARLQHRSASSLLRELLDASTPFLRAVLPVLQAREAAVEEMPGKLEKAALGALQALLGDDPAQLDLVDHIASVMASQGAPTGSPGEGAGAAADREGAQRTAAAPAPSPAQPPYSNTGVRSDQTGNIQASRGHRQVSHG